MIGEVLLDSKPDNKAKILECSIQSIRDPRSSIGRIEVEIQSMINIKALWKF